MKNLLKRFWRNMADWKWYFIEIIIIAAFVAAFIFLGLVMLPEKPQKIYIFTEKIREDIKYPLFEHAISEIGNRPYTENYKCYDFSKDLVKELEKIGIKSSIAIDEKREHAWVLVWIEATTGNFNLADNNLEILELRDKNLKVICD